MTSFIVLPSSLSTLCTAPVHPVLIATFQELKFCNSLTMAGRSSERNPIRHRISGFQSGKVGSSVAQLLASRGIAHGRARVDCSHGDPETASSGTWHRAQRASGRRRTISCCSRRKRKGGGDVGDDDENEPTNCGRSKDNRETVRAESHHGPQGRRTHRQKFCGIR